MRVKSIVRCWSLYCIYSWGKTWVTPGKIKTKKGKIQNATPTIHIPATIPGGGTEQGENR